MLASLRGGTLSNTNQENTMQELEIWGRKLRKSFEPAYEPFHEDPIQELKDIVRQHNAIINQVQRHESACRDRKVLKDTATHKKGDTLPSPLPEPIKALYKDVDDALDKAAEKYVSRMTVNLRRVDIYNVLLKKMHGVGPKTAAYLVSHVDPQRCQYVTQLWRMAGICPVNGAIERGTKGQKLPYHKPLRRQLHQYAHSMRRSAGVSGRWVTHDQVPPGMNYDDLEQREQKGQHQYKLPSATAPFGVTSKYLKVWEDYKQAMQTSPRVDRKNNIVVPGECCDLIPQLHADLLQLKTIDTNGKKAVFIMKGRKRLCQVKIGAKSWIDNTGWRKATDIMLFDVYLVWRSMLGLTTWPTWWCKKRGYLHGGEPCDDWPKQMSLDEALAFVGEVGSYPRTCPRPVFD
jgi:hypothetical protein